MFPLAEGCDLKVIELKAVLQKPVSAYARPGDIVADPDPA
jgi:hypothetical protein